jgi:hypothetical protein
MECWNNGILGFGNLAKCFIGQIYHEEKLNQIFTAQPIIPLLHYSNTPIAKRSGAKFMPHFS